MNCPNCTERLTPSDTSGIQTYTCKYCSGIWVPERSIAALFQKEQKNITTQWLVNEAVDAGEAKRKCATCTNNYLHGIHVQNIGVDACKKCYGLFLSPEALSGIFPDSKKIPSGGYGVGEHIASEGVLWLIIAFFTGSC